MTTYDEFLDRMNYNKNAIKVKFNSIKFFNKKLEEKYEEYECDLFRKRSLFYSIGIFSFNFLNLFLALTLNQDDMYFYSTLSFFLVDFLFLIHYFYLFFKKKDSKKQIKNFVVIRYIVLVFEYFFSALMYVISDSIQSRQFFIKYIYLLIFIKNTGYYLIIDNSIYLMIFLHSFVLFILIYLMVVTNIYSTDFDDNSFLNSTGNYNNNKYTYMKKYVSFNEFFLEYALLFSTFYVKRYFLYINKITYFEKNKLMKSFFLSEKLLEGLNFFQISFEKSKIVNISENLKNFINLNSKFFSKTKNQKIYLSLNEKKNNQYSIIRQTSFNNQEENFEKHENFLDIKSGKEFNKKQITLNSESENNNEKDTIFNEFEEKQKVENFLRELISSKDRNLRLFEIVQKMIKDNFEKIKKKQKNLKINSIDENEKKSTSNKYKIFSKISVLQKIFKFKTKKPTSNIKITLENEKKELISDSFASKSINKNLLMNTDHDFIRDNDILLMSNTKQFLSEKSQVKPINYSQNIEAFNNDDYLNQEVLNNDRLKRIKKNSLFFNKNNSSNVNHSKNLNFLLKSKSHFNNISDNCHFIKINQKNKIPIIKTNKMELDERKNFTFFKEENSKSFDEIGDFSIEINGKIFYYKAIIVKLKSNFEIFLNEINKQDKEIDSKDKFDETEKKIKHKILSKIGHEFKTPINCILGLINNLKNQLRSSRMSMDLDLIQSLSNYTIYLISDLIQYASDDYRYFSADFEKNKNEIYKKLNISFNFFDIKKNLFFCFDILNALLACNDMKKDRIEAELYIEDKLNCFKVINDEIRINQILLNLISNAVKQTKRGKIIIVTKFVSIQKKENGKEYNNMNINENEVFEYFHDNLGIMKNSSILKINSINQKSTNPTSNLIENKKKCISLKEDLRNEILQKNNKSYSRNAHKDFFLKISIIDTGIGISMERQKNIFKEELKINTELEFNHQGSELGLSICLRLIKLINGKILLSSKENVGSIFSILIPAIKISNCNEKTQKAITSKRIDQKFPGRKITITKSDKNLQTLSDITDNISEKKNEIQKFIKSNTCENNTMVYLKNFLIEKEKKNTLKKTSKIDEVIQESANKSDKKATVQKNDEFSISDFSDNDLRCNSKNKKEIQITTPNLINMKKLNIPNLRTYQFDTNKKRLFSFNIKNKNKNLLNDRVKSNPPILKIQDKLTLEISPKYMKSKIDEKFRQKNVKRTVSYIKPFGRENFNISSPNRNISSGEISYEEDMKICYNPSSSEELNLEIEKNKVVYISKEIEFLDNVVSYVNYIRSKSIIDKYNEENSNKNMNDLYNKDEFEFSRLKIEENPKKKDKLFGKFNNEQNKIFSTIIYSKKNSYEESFFYPFPSTKYLNYKYDENYIYQKSSSINLSYSFNQTATYNLTNTLLCPPILDFLNPNLKFKKNTTNLKRNRFNSSKQNIIYINNNLTNNTFISTNNHNKISTNADHNSELNSNANCYMNFNNCFSSDPKTIQMSDLDNNCTGQTKIQNFVENFNYLNKQYSGISRISEGDDNMTKIIERIQLDSSNLNIHDVLVNHMKINDKVENAEFLDNFKSVPEYNADFRDNYSPFNMKRDKRQGTVFSFNDKNSNSNVLYSSRFLDKEEFIKEINENGINDILYNKNIDLIRKKKLSVNYPFESIFNDNDKIDLKKRRNSVFIKNPNLSKISNYDGFETKKIKTLKDVNSKDFIKNNLKKRNESLNNEIFKNTTFAKKNQTKDISEGSILNLSNINRNRKTNKFDEEGNEFDDISNGENYEKIKNNYQTGKFDVLSNNYLGTIKNLLTNNSQINLSEDIKYSDLIKIIKNEIKSNWNRCLTIEKCEEIYFINAYRKNNESSNITEFNECNKKEKQLIDSNKSKIKINFNTSLNIPTLEGKNLLDNINNANNVTLENKLDVNNKINDPLTTRNVKIDEIQTQDVNKLKNISNKNKNAFAFLVIDDNLYIRNSVKNILNLTLKNLRKKSIIKSDTEIFEGVDGIDALKYLIDPDVGARIKTIFIDENMEYLNGSETVKIIRKLQNSKKIHKFSIATVTAFEDPTTKETIINAGVDEIYPKPLTKNHLEEFFKKHPII